MITSSRQVWGFSVFKAATFPTNVSGSRVKELQTGVGELLSYGISSGRGAPGATLADRLAELRSAHEDAHLARGHLAHLGYSGASLAALLPASLAGGAAGLGVGLGAGVLGAGAIGGTVGGVTGMANGMYSRRRAQPSRSGESSFSKRAGVLGRAGELLSGSRARGLENAAAQLATKYHTADPKTLQGVQHLYEAAQNERKNSARFNAALVPLIAAPVAGLSGAVGLAGGALVGANLGAGLGVAPGAVAGTLAGWHAGGRFSRNRAEKRASFDRLGRLFVASEGFKGASADDTVYESEEDARKRRLGELLRRRQRSGTDTGSLYPQSPRDNR